MIHARVGCEYPASFIAAALAKNASLSLIKYPAGDHGFEILNDTDETRRAIAQRIAWVKSQNGHHRPRVP